MTRYKYSVEEDEFKSDLDISYDDYDIEYLAICAAKDLLRDAGGDLHDEKEWPLLFSIYDDKDILIGKAEVHLDYEPNFVAYELRV